MGMPAEQGLSVLYVLADQWLRERQTMVALGAEDPAPLDDLVGRVVAPRRDVERDQRIALARSLDGEVIG
jgi:hypothetical protein